MKKLNTMMIALLAGSVAFMTSCKKNNDDSTPSSSELTVNTVSDLDGSKGNVYYSLSTNKQITGADTATTKWDLKFSSTKIYINGGTSGSGSTQAQVVSSTFADLTAAPTSGYTTDSSTSTAITGWYTYTATTEPQHAILMVPGKIIVIKTTSGNYAKLEMKSYYKGNPDVTTSTFADLTTRPTARFYTFRFAYQAANSTSLQ